MKKKMLIVKHADNEGPGLIADLFEKAGQGIHVVNLAREQSLPHEPSDFAGCILLGGPMNVYEESLYPFLKDEYFFIKTALEKSVPFLGICLGAQLLAKAAGAEVKKAPVKEFGWYEVNTLPATEKDRLFTGVPESFEVFQWHEDTFDIPAGGELLIKSDSVFNQAFRAGKKAYGLQFHVEATPDMIEEWVIGEDIDNEEEIISKARKNQGKTAYIANVLLNNFMAIMD